MPPIGAVVSSSWLLDFEPAAALGTRNTFAIASGLDEDAALLAVYLDVPVGNVENGRRLGLVGGSVVDAQAMDRRGSLARTSRE
jgi:hypothetical protein